MSEPYQRIGGLFYLVLTVIGLLWIGIREDDWELLFAADPPGPAVAAGTGVISAFLIVRFSDRFLEGSAWAGRLREDVREFLGPITRRRAVVVGLCSGIGEELFFRGALQPHLGLWITSLLFGFLHGGFDRRMWGWALFATVVGLWFGALFSLTGGLVAPTTAHVLVNGAQLWRLADEESKRVCEPPSIDE